MMKDLVEIRQQAQKGTKKCAKQTANRQLRIVLREGGIKVVRDEFNIIDRQDA